MSLEERQLSIKEIVIRHQVSRQGVPILDRNDQNSTTVGYYKVKNPNPYAIGESIADTEELTLQIKILDVLYNNQICSLVYMHDLTSVIDGYKA